MGAGVEGGEVEVAESEREEISGGGEVDMFCGVVCWRVGMVVEFS